MKPRFHNEVQSYSEMACLHLLIDRPNEPFAASGHMVHAGGQAAHWDIQNKATSSR